MGLQHFYDKGPHPLLWAGPRAARGKITVGGRPNCLVTTHPHLKPRFKKEESYTYIPRLGLHGLF